MNSIIRYWLSKLFKEGIDMEVMANERFDQENNNGDDYNKYNQKLNKYADLYIPFYVTATVIWMACVLITGDINNKVVTWQNYVCFMILLGVIHVWNYAILKNKHSRTELGKLFPNSNKYEEILEDYDKLSEIKPSSEEDDDTRRRIKIMYSGLWFSVSVVILLCCACIYVYLVLNKYLANGLVIGVINAIILAINWLLLGIGLWVNHKSYYASMVFCYFTRQIANEDINCDCSLPWNSKDLRKLINISSRSSISFFVVSVMYMIVLAINFGTTRGISSERIKSYWILLIALSTFLGVISFMLFTFLPKVFLNRLFRKWKFKNVKGLMKADAILKTSSNEDRIEKIWSSNLPLVRMEVFTGIISLLIDFAALIVSIVVK